jgi:hypothetical protein
MSFRVNELRFERTDDGESAWIVAFLEQLDLLTPTRYIWHTINDQGDVDAGHALLLPDDGIVGVTFLVRPVNWSQAEVTIRVSRVSFEELRKVDVTSRGWIAADIGTRFESVTFSMTIPPDGFEPNITLPVSDTEDYAKADRSREQAAKVADVLLARFPKPD